MNVDKAKKLIAKQVKKGVKGFPQVTLRYFGKSTQCATIASIEYIQEEGGAPQEQRFTSSKDARDDEVIQSALVKIIQRADAQTVIENPEVVVID
ncbi:hypothetical protein [Aliiglaciecola sp. LCG003]|uniref:hypothetical protein n=1 Tax=Aliiglaciecola sp. LCG003 TaxID=3053655 RepID=UPI00257468D5|nr:hypothetical protein [Aliiglaciecola sp. LCG003]WJG11209.1 hypothetical protein QR722_09330 [Aliiglaciecola sp. LCG003]